MPVKMTFLPILQFLKNYFSYFFNQDRSLRTMQRHKIVSGPERLLN